MHLRFGVRPEKARALAERFERLGVREADLEERFVRAGGPGGQKINKTSIAVWLRHGPSGTEVKFAGSRSQALNRFEARRLLAERMEAKILGKQSEEQQRIEKIRRQKRRKSRRQKQRMVADKRAHGAIKAMRGKPGSDD